MQYVIGLDIGTTATKALLVSQEGKVIADAHKGYALSTPAPHIVEQSPQDLWRACVDAIRAVAAHARSGEVAGIGLSTQGGTFLGLDERDKPIGQAITWLDKRAEEEGRRLAEQKGAVFFLERSGLSGPGLVVPKLLWLRTHQPERCRSVRRWAFVNDYTVLRLTGQAVADPSNVCLCGLYNLWTNGYDRDMLALAELAEDALAPIAESGTAVGSLTAEAAETLGLSERTVVGAAGHDQYCAALGAGIVRPGDMLLGCGTAWVLLSPTHAPKVDPGGEMLPGRHLLPGLYGVLAAISDGGVVWDWFNRMLFGDAVDYDQIERIVSAVPAGCDGVRCWPGFVRTDTPLPVGPGGALLGLSLSATRGHILRSAMEGLAMEARRRVEGMARLGIRTRRVSMIGGAARSGVWPQIVSDVLGVPLTVPENREAAAVGAAILGLKAAGLIPDLQSGCRVMRGKERTLTPDPKHRETYDALFGQHGTVAGR